MDIKMNQPLNSSKVLGAVVVYYLIEEEKRSRKKE